MRIVILLFRQLNFVVANYDCELCEVQPWNDWSGTDSTCGSAIQTRRRVCSSPDGWTLGLTCNDKDRKTIPDSRDVVLPACRKLNLNVKLLKIIYFMIYL